MIRIFSNPRIYIPKHTPERIISRKIISTIRKKEEKLSGSKKSISQNYFFNKKGKYVFVTPFTKKEYEKEFVIKLREYKILQIFK